MGIHILTTRCCQISHARDLTVVKIHVFSCSNIKFQKQLLYTSLVIKKMKIKINKNMNVRYWRQIHLTVQMWNNNKKKNIYSVIKYPCAWIKYYSCLHKCMLLFVCLSTHLSLYLGKWHIYNRLTLHLASIICCARNCIMTIKFYSSSLSLCIFLEEEEEEEMKIYIYNVNTIVSGECHAAKSCGSAMDLTVLMCIYCNPSS